MGMDRHQDAKSQQEADYGSAAQTDKRQGHSYNRQQARNHADIYKYINKKGLFI